MKELVEGDIEVGEILCRQGLEQRSVGGLHERANQGRYDRTIQPSLCTHRGARSREAELRSHLLRALGARYQRSRPAF